MASIKQRFLGLINCYMHVDGKLLAPHSAKFSTGDYRYRYQYTPRIPIRAGWYMLAVSGHKSLVAQRLLLCADGAECAHVQITAKPVTKRIIMLESGLDCVDILSNIEPQSIAALQLSLTRLSNRFAISRIRRKLKFASNLADYSADLSNIRNLYQIYSGVIDKRNSGASYHSWHLNRRSGKSSSGVSVPPAGQGASIELICHSDNPVDITVNNADYFCFIGPDAVMEEGFEGVIEAAIANSPEADLFYPDHDVVTSGGHRSEPCFKPGWNAEMLLSGNYIGQVAIVSRNIVQRYGTPDSSLGNSSLYAFLLRIMHDLDESNVCRMAAVLYSYPDSRSGIHSFLSTGNHDRKVLQQHAESMELRADIGEGLIPGSMSVMWRLPKPLPVVDIIIPTRDNVGILRRCVESVLGKTDYPDYLVTLVDNGSQDPETEQYYLTLQSEPRVSLLRRPGKFNYSALNNYAVDHTGGDVLLLLNNDTEAINGDWLANLVAQACRPDIACVGAKLHYPTGQIQHAGVIMGMFGMAGHAHRLFDSNDDGYCGRLKIAHNITAVTAACLAVRRNVYNQLGQLDEVNLQVAYNDIDFCLRAREAGYRNIWTPYAELYHHESVSRGSEDTRQKKQRFQREFAYMQKRWSIHTFIDSAYNPNLALDAEDFSLAA